MYCEKKLELMGFNKKEINLIQTDVNKKSFDDIKIKLKSLGFHMKENIKSS